jgi:hypothetical protein
VLVCVSLSWDLEGNREHRARCDADEEILPPDFARSSSPGQTSCVSGHSLSRSTLAGHHATEGESAAGATMPTLPRFPAPGLGPDALRSSTRYLDTRRGRGLPESHSWRWAQGSRGHPGGGLDRRLVQKVQLHVRPGRAGGASWGNLGRLRRRWQVAIVLSVVQKDFLSHHPTRRSLAYLASAE